MLKGTYNITLRSPLGPRYGKLTLEESNSKLRGSLDILGSHNMFQDGYIQNNQFSFSADIHTLLGCRRVKVTGYFEEYALVGFLTLSLKQIPFTAVRVVSD